MAIVMKDFLTQKEIVFIGLSSNPKSFSRMVHKTFLDAGFKVYAVNENKFNDSEVEVYGAVDQIREVPECAYIILSQENTKKAVNNLKDTGIKKVIFQSTKTVDQATLDECAKMGIETVVACPMMFLSNGLIHRIHAFFAGVKK